MTAYEKTREIIVASIRLRFTDMFPTMYFGFCANPMSMMFHNRKGISNYSTIYLDRVSMNEIEYSHYDVNHVRQNRTILLLADPSFISTLIGLISKDFNNVQPAKIYAQTHNT